MMGGVKLSMGRVKCAMLSLNATKQGLRDAGKLGRHPERSIERAFHRTRPR